MLQFYQILLQKQKDPWDKIIHISEVKVKVKVKSLYLTSVVPSVIRLVSMEAKGARVSSISY